MNKHLLILIAIFTGFAAAAQHTNQCGIIIPPTSLRSNFSSVYEARGYINNMLDLVNWQQNFQIREQNGINNAYATIIRNQRYIVYDNRFLESLDQYAGTKLASICVLAHEMGHHYHNHVVSGTGGSSISKELEADYFSGYVLAKMGASLEDATAAMSQIASPRASATHPAKNDRSNAITRGWNSAGKVQDVREKPTVSVEPPKTPAPNDADWIHLSLYGNESMNVFLSDDGRQFTKATLKTTEPFVFKYEVYNYGWLRFGNGRTGKTYKLYHGKDYAIVWNRRTGSWSLIEVS